MHARLALIAIHVSFVTTTKIVIRKNNNKKILLTKESNKHDGRRINARYTRVRLDAVQWRDPFVSATFIATLRYNVVST